ncbi:MAG TPA: alpha/beta fold hydrolase [Burkholderiaceae bacterium]|jgi:polyhydroxyalkanoate synthase|nr:alpha/beta fold hydrolase [Burkholderiaceae bacterium]
MTYPASFTAPIRLAFEQADHLRRLQGGMLAAAGAAPAETPYRVLHAQAGVALRRYGDRSSEGMPLLLVPAPIKRCYIWDLLPAASVVRRALERGLRVYLVDWTPVENPAREFALGDYGGRLLLACADAIRGDSGQQAILLAGHSLGGTLATIFACLHPQRVRKLALLEAPLHFAAAAGSFAPLVAAVHDATPIAAMFGSVPGSFLDWMSVLAAPDEFERQRFADLWSCAGDAGALAVHMRVERWLLDEFSMPGGLFADIVERLYRDDLLMRGLLRIEERKAGPAELAVPLLNVFDPRSAVIPPQSILAFHYAAASRSKKLLEYAGDVGVGIQHVGILVGRRAHAQLWPAVLDWLLDRETPVHGARRH